MTAAGSASAGPPAGDAASGVAQADAGASPDSNDKEGQPVRGRRSYLAKGRCKVALPPRCTTEPPATVPHDGVQIPTDVTKKNAGRYQVDSNGAKERPPDVVPPSKKKKHQHLHIQRDPEVNERISYKELRCGSKVGRGSQGSVRKATYVKDGKEFYFALKEIQGTHNPASLHSMSREMGHLTLSAQYIMKSLVMYYEAYWIKDKSTLAILMEWMDYGSIRDVMKALERYRRDNEDVSEYYGPPSRLNTPLSDPPSSHSREGDSTSLEQHEFDPGLARIIPKDVAIIAYHALHGLNALMNFGILHNDIKPQNILVNRRGQVKIGDFGVTAWTDSISMAPTGANNYGAQGYMAPERIAGERFSYQADVWGLGMTLAECALGRFPFKSMKLFNMCKEIAEGKVRIVLPDGLDDDLQDFIWKCMDNNWKDRPKPTALLEHPFIKKHVTSDSPVPEFLPIIERYYERDASQTQG